jgi:flagellar export protein FliJ
MFIFRLERVLNYRKKLKEKAQQVFSKKRAELLRIENNIHDEKEKLGSFIKKNPLKEGIFTVSEIIAVDNYINKTRGTIQKLHDMRKDKEAEVMDALSTLNDAKKAAKVMENLKKRRFERYNQDQRRIENTELDDINQKISLNKEKLTIEDMPVEDM